MSKRIIHTNTSNSDLMKLLSEKREELRVVRFTAAGSRPKDTTTQAKIRKEIARILTEFSSRTQLK